MLLKNAVEMTCLQQNVLVLDKDGEHLSLNLLLVLINFLLCSFVLFLVILRFVFVWKAIIGDA